MSDTQAPASAGTIRWRRVWAAYSFGALVVWATSFWPLVVSLPLGAAVAYGLYARSERLDRWLAEQLDSIAPQVPHRGRRVAIAAGIAAAMVALPVFYLWGESGPFDPWNRHALLWPTIVALVVYPFLIGAPGRLRLVSAAAVAWAAIIGVFVFLGGPFAARWQRCEARLTDAVLADAPINETTVGWFCWQDATKRTVADTTRLYLEGGVTGLVGQGLAYSPDGSIETAADIQWVRPLGDGWYVFVTHEAQRIRSRWDF